MKAKPTILRVVRGIFLPLPTHVRVPMPSLFTAARGRGGGKKLFSPFPSAVPPPESWGCVRKCTASCRSDTPQHSSLPRHKMKKLKKLLCVRQGFKGMQARRDQEPGTRDEIPRDNCCCGGKTTIAPYHTDSTKRFTNCSRRPKQEYSCTCKGVSNLALQQCKGALVVSLGAYHIT